jgi:hypothetical protein
MASREWTDEQRAPDSQAARATGMRSTCGLAGCGVGGAAGANDPAAAARRTTAQDQHAGGGEPDPVPAHLPRNHFPPRSTVYNIFRKLERDGVGGATGVSPKTLRTSRKHCKSSSPSPSSSLPTGGLRGSRSISAGPVAGGNGCYGFGEGRFASTHGNGQDAP